MKKIWMGAFLIASPMLYFAISSVSKQEQVQSIDEQIQELKEMKRGFESRAIRAEDQASRLQFEEHFMLETRRYNKIAEENRAKAQKVQEEIDRLEAKKASIQK